MAFFRFGKRLAIISSFVCVSPSSFSGPHHTWVKHLDVLKVTEAVFIRLFFFSCFIINLFFLHFILDYFYCYVFRVIILLQFIIFC